MSKFSDKLSSLGQSTPARMGFGRSAAREKNPVMLVIGRGGAAKDDAKGADVQLLTAVPSSKKGSTDSEWGLVADGSKAPDTEALVKDGCQFLLVTSEDVNAEILLAEEIALGMPVVDHLGDPRIRSIEDSPFEFLLYKPESISWPLTVGSVLKLQDLVSSYSKHIFLELPSGTDMPGEKDLEVLKNLPVSAIVIDLEQVKSGDAKKLKEAVGKLEPRKPSSKSDRSPLVPLSGRNASEDVDAGDDGFGEEDDDWEE